MFRLPYLTVLALFMLSGCAFQRSEDALTARQRMVGMTKEQVFACMGLPKRKGIEGNTEIWAYTSGNNRTDSSRLSTSLSRKQNSGSDSLWDDLGSSLTLTETTRESRYCIVQVVLSDNLVKAVNYSGPSGGFLTNDEQCAYAVRNCLLK